jgi:hypothetical protein
VLRRRVDTRDPAPHTVVTMSTAAVNRHSVLVLIA